MMEPFRFKRTSAFGAPRPAWIIGAVLLIIAVAITPYIRDGIAGLLYSTGDVGQYTLLSRTALIERLQNAESEIARTRYQSVLYAWLADDRARLMKELHLREQDAYMTARVVASPPKTHYDTLLIASGSDDGVRAGDVATIEGIALGSVTDVSLGSSIVELYSSPGATRDAYLGSPRSIVVVHGLGGGSFEATVPGAVAVQVGDVVTDTTTNRVFAVVLSISKKETDTSASVKMAVPVTVSGVPLVSFIHAP